MTKIILNDSLPGVIAKMSEGNPGAMTAMVELVQDGGLIDPQDMLQPFSSLLGLDAWGIYGTAIYILWHDKCDRDVRRLIILLRATQLGKFPASKLIAMAADQYREINITPAEIAALDAAVCKRLPGFLKPTEWRDILAKRLEALEAKELRAMTKLERESNPTCAERVAGHWESRRADLYVLYCTVDPRIRDNSNIDEFLSDLGYTIVDLSDDEKAEAIDEARSTYALSFDYVEPDTFIDQPEGYFRYQISWGGPSDELRFFIGLDSTCHRAEYWFLDWGDGASLDVTEDEVARAVFGDFADAGMIKLPE